MQECAVVSLWAVRLPRRQRRQRHPLVPLVPRVDVSAVDGEGDVLTRTRGVVVGCRRRRRRRCCCSCCCCCVVVYLDLACCLVSHSHRVTPTARVLKSSRGVSELCAVYVMLMTTANRAKEPRLRRSGVCTCARHVTKVRWNAGWSAGPRFRRTRRELCR